MDHEPSDQELIDLAIKLFCDLRDGKLKEWPEWVLSELARQKTEVHTEYTR